MLPTKTVQSRYFVHQRIARLMGNRFEISIVTSDTKEADAHIDAAFAEISRIEYILTTFNDNSQTNLINRNAGVRPVKVDTEVQHLIARSLKLSALTQGAFDITYGSFDKSLWNFDLSMTALPDPGFAAQSIRLINYTNVLIDHQRSTVFLRERGMRIGFGAIGKGYAADRASELLKNRGVENGIVNAAGDLITWGKQIDGNAWTIGIADPDQRTISFSKLQISDMAIATSGDYEKFVIIDGKRYSHTINPKTGLPVSGIKSVSIICPSAELSDALATPVMVMGVEVGLDLINQLHQVECIIIDDLDNLHFSKNINTI